MAVKVTWYGHAMFMVESGQLRVVTDPYSEEVGYMLPHLEAEAVLVSHDHFDHNNFRLVGGSPAVLRDPGPAQVGPVRFEGLLTDHDAEEGTKRGKNVIFRWEMDNITMAHLGDYGEGSLTAEQQSFLRGVDLLLIPVGGLYTIDAAAARRVVEAAAPRVVVPMHFKTSAIAGWEITGVDDFLRGQDRIKYLASTVTVEKEDLPAEREIWVLQPAAG